MTSALFFCTVYANVQAEHQAYANDVVVAQSLEDLKHAATPGHSQPFNRFRPAFKAPLSSRSGPPPNICYICVEGVDEYAAIHYTTPGHDSRKKHYTWTGFVTEPDIAQWLYLE